jgi:hypothetical protein
MYWKKFSDETASKCKIRNFGEASPAAEKDSRMMAMARI